VKTLLIPFDPRLSNKGKFDSLFDALTFVQGHCMVHHGIFTKQLARKYLNFCRILDGPRNEYVVMNGLSKKDFDTTFNQVKQRNEENGGWRKKTG
jgi:hypothetical protein